MFTCCSVLLIPLKTEDEAHSKTTIERLLARTHFAYVPSSGARPRHVVDCVGEWAGMRNRVSNRVRLHHQIDQAFPIFRVQR